MRLVRYADDFPVMVNGTRQDAEALREEIDAASRRPTACGWSAASTSC
ncbi:hypothetical protein [Streptomyces prasinus]